jgi:hypothetical protein
MEDFAPSFSQTLIVFVVAALGEVSENRVARVGIEEEVA